MRDPPRPRSGRAEAQPANGEIAILWLTAGLELRRRHHRHDGGHPAEPRGPARRRHPLDPQGQALQSVPGSRESATSSSRTSTAAPAASWARSFWWSRARSPTRPTRRRDTGPRSAPIPPPASRSPPATGSTGWRRGPGRCSPPAPAPRTAASTRWRATPPVPWGCPTTWAGAGDRRAGCPIVCLPGLPGAARQHDRDAALPAASVRRPRSADPPR